MMTQQKAPTLESLTAEYEAWNKAEGLNLGSADEHLFDPQLTPAQRLWLVAFCNRWEEVEQRTLVRVGDFVRKDGKLVRVESTDEETLYTSDGGCIGRDEVSESDVLLESEGYDEFYGVAR